MSMKIAAFTKPNKIEILEVSKPKILDSEILIKIDACAICTWEQRVYQGIKSVPYPFIGGHEIAAEIVEIGVHVSKDIWDVGDKVVYGTNLTCGYCHQCRIGNQQNCEHFDHTQSIRDSEFSGFGGFGEYMAVQPHHLYKYETINPIEATLIEPVSCCVHSIESSNVELSDTVMVVGCGIMGLIHVQLAVKKGAYVIAVDRDDSRLKLARQYGAHAIINNKTLNLKETLDTLTDGKGVNHIFNTTPLSSVAQEMQEYLSINGTQTLYSSFYPNTPITIDPDALHKKATRIIGTANSNPKDFTRAILLVEKGIISVRNLISEVYDFEDIESALNRSLSPETLRVVVEINMAK